LTERDYLAIGICAGFLFMLYMFAMIVFIIIKKKQKRDKRLREQFLQLPVPQGIGYKSSRILGLEDSYLTDIAKLANEARHSQRMKNGGKCELHNKSQGNLPCAKNQVRSKESPSHSDNNISFKINEHLLNAHRKQVESQLQQEIATAVHCCDSDNSQDTCGESMPKLNLGLNGKTVVKRFFPHLEEIPEESRNNTLKDLNIKNDSLDGSDSGDSSNLSSIELNEIRMTSAAESSQDSTSRSNLQSMDSGIVTRSSSPTPDHGSDNDGSSSHEIYSDNETVDVADSYTDDTNSDKDVNEDLQEDNHELNITKFGSHIVGCKNNLDFLSEIYNTAFSKLPKVQKSDPESDYSYYSSSTSADKDIEYDSLDFKYKENKFRSFTNPRPYNKLGYEKADSNLIYEEIPDKQHTSEVYIISNNDIFSNKTVEARNDEVRTDIKYSSGERMMISISHDNSNVYSDKLLITVNEDDKNDEVVNCEDSHEFDPDTLERNLDKRNEHPRPELEAQETFHNSDTLNDESSQNIHSLYTPVKKNGYSFHLRPNDERSRNNIENIFRNVSENIPDKVAQDRTKNKSGLDKIMQNHAASSVAASQVKSNLESEGSSEESSAPILPPKKRVTPKLPPKPFLVR